MSFETLVRPFQSRDLGATRRIIATNAKVDVTPAVLIWGVAGAIAKAEQLVDPPDDGSGFKVITKKDTWLEKSRETETVRIYKNETDANGKLQIDPATGDPVIDPDIFVDVERIETVDFKKVDKRKYPTGKEIDDTGKYTEALAANTAIVGNQHISLLNKEERAKYIMKNDPHDR